MNHFEYRRGGVDKGRRDDGYDEEMTMKKRRFI